MLQKHSIEIKCLINFWGGIPEGIFLITKPLNHLKELVLNAYYTLIYILLRNKCF